MPDIRPAPQALTLSRRVVFLHIAKTAGTSIIHFFQQRLSAEKICSHGDFLTFPERGDLFQAQLRRYQFVSGHFGYADVEPLLKESYSFTFLRDPVDRVLSLYKFCMHSDMQKQFAVARAARDLGLEGFLSSTLPEVSEMLDNQQTWQLSSRYWHKDRRAMSGLGDHELLDMAISHLDDFDHVGLTDNFDKDFGKILGDLEINEQVPKSRQFKTRDPVSSEQLSTAVLDSLRERLRLDYALLEHVEQQVKSDSTDQPYAK
ncbi:MAG: sulfotransferase family 2 domain-containing protein [Halieaceae bacterium]